MGRIGGFGIAAGRRRGVVPEPIEAEKALRVISPDGDAAASVQGVRDGKGHAE